MSPSTGRGQSQMLQNRKRAEEAKLASREAAIERRLRAERQRSQLAGVMATQQRSAPAPLMSATELRSAVTQDEGLRRLEQRLRAAYVNKTRTVQVQEKAEARAADAAATAAVDAVATARREAEAAKEAENIALAQEKARAVDAERKAIEEQMNYQQALKSFVVSFCLLLLPPFVGQVIVTHAPHLHAHRRPTHMFSPHSRTPRRRNGRRRSPTSKRARKRRQRTTHGSVRWRRCRK